jgi:hypothetical protein
MVIDRLAEADRPPDEGEPGDTWEQPDPEDPDGEET